MKSEKVAEGLVERFRAVDSCAVSDACDLLEIDSAVTDLHCVTNVKRTIAGVVMPVELEQVNEDDNSTPQDSAPRHLCTAAIEASGPDDVLVIAHRGEMSCAGWGGNLTRAAKVRGISGALVDGAVRDVDESRGLDFALHARGVTPRTARGRVRERTWGEPIRFAGVQVARGDFVVADGSGVVFVPAEHASRVVAKAESIIAKESRMAESIESGHLVSDVMGRDYETMTSRSNGGA